MNSYVGQLIPKVEPPPGLSAQRTDAAPSGFRCRCQRVRLRVTLDQQIDAGSSVQQSAKHTAQMLKLGHKPHACLLPSHSVFH